MTKRHPIAYAEAVDLDGVGIYRVVAENKNGFRWVLGNYGHKDADRVARLAAKVQAAGTIDIDLWVPHWPRYGSDAYEAEAFEASMYAEGIRAGFVNEADVPANIRTLL